MTKEKAAPLTLSKHESSQGKTQHWWLIFGQVAQPQFHAGNKKGESLDSPFLVKRVESRFINLPFAPILCPWFL